MTSRCRGPRRGWVCSCVYEVTTDEQSQAQIEHLPAAALVAFAEARAALEVAPWTAGKPYHPHRPDGPMRARTASQSMAGWDSRTSRSPAR